MAGGPGRGSRDDDYDWLYGKDGKPTGQSAGQPTGQSGQGGEEHTRILRPG